MKYYKRFTRDIQAAMEAERVAVHEDLYLSITQQCVLMIGNEENVIELSAEQVLELGDFLHATEGLWRP
jgi:hypothetical protein